MPANWRLNNYDRDAASGGMSKKSPKDPTAFAYTRVADDGTLAVVWRDLSDDDSKKLLRVIFDRFLSVWKVVVSINGDPGGNRGVELRTLSPPS